VFTVHFCFILLTNSWIWIPVFISVYNNMEREELMDNLTPRRAVRERTRSESGKENSIRPVVPQRQRRSERTLLRERYTDAVMATTLAAVAALSATGDDGGDDRQSTTESPIEFCTVTDSALPSDSDHGPWGDQHSSEEELECINGAEEESMAHDLLTTPAASSSGTALRFGPSAFGPPRFCPNQHNNNNQQQPRKVVQPQVSREIQWERRKPFFFSKQKKRLYKFCVGSREAKVGPSEPPAFERADEKSSAFGRFIASRLDD
jgi:hypothetical protein